MSDSSDSDEETLGALIAMRAEGFGRSEGRRPAARSRVRPRPDADAAAAAFGDGEDEGGESDGSGPTGAMAPKEIPSKRWVSGRRQVITTPVVRTRDPRFDDALGVAPDAIKFRHKYGFLIDDVLETDIQKTKRALKKARKQHSRDRLQNELREMKQQRGEARVRLGEAEALRKVKAAQRDAAKSGKGVYFPKRRELKDLVLKERFRQIRDEGGAGAVDRVVRKKRARNAARDRRRLGEGPPGGKRARGAEE